MLVVQSRLQVCYQEQKSKNGVNVLASRCLVVVGLKLNSGVALRSCGAAARDHRAPRDPLRSGACLARGVLKFMIRLGATARNDTTPSDLLGISELVSTGFTHLMNKQRVACTKRNHRVEATSLGEHCRAGTRKRTGSSNVHSNSDLMRRARSNDIQCVVQKISQGVFNTAAVGRQGTGPCPCVSQYLVVYP